MANVLTAGQLLAPSLVSANPWVLETSLAVTEKYDDNINMTETNETADFVTTLLPGVRVYRIGDRLALSASYRANMEAYANHHDSNNISHLAFAEVTMTGFGGGVLQKAQLRITDSFTDTDRLSNFPVEGAVIGNGGVIIPPTPTMTNSGTIVFSVPFTDTLNGQVSYTRTFVRYNQTNLIDNTQQGVTASLSDQWTSQISTGASYTYSIINYDTPSTISTPQNSENQVSHAGDFFLNDNISPTISIGLRAGLIYFSNSSEIATTGSFSISKRFQYTTALVSYSRQFSSGSGLYSQPSIDDSVSAVVSQTIGQRAHADLTGSYDNSRPTGGGHGSSHSYGVGASIDYSITSWLHSAVIYRHIAQQATLDSIDPTTGELTTMNIRDNTIAIMLNGAWEFGTPTLAAQAAHPEHGVNQ